MMLRAGRCLVLLGVSCVAPLLLPAAAAQARDGRLRPGIRAYEQLDYAVAAALLRGELAAPGALPDSDRAVALVYLGATELFRGRQDSAVAAFQRLVLLRPGFRPDPLTFPPEVTDLVRQVRRDTRAVIVEVPRTTELAVGREQFAARLVASAYHMVQVTVTFENGSPVRTLYAGPIGDSLLVTWDGRDTAGAVVSGGAYWLRVSSRTPAGAAVRHVQLPLTVRRVEPDTLSLPPPPADSLWRRERRAAGPALRALASGAVVSAAVLALPSVAAQGSKPGGARFAVAGAVTLTGVVSFLMRRPGQLISDNARANRDVRDAWQRQVRAVQLENVARRQAVRLVIDAGTAHVIEADAP